MLFSSITFLYYFLPITLIIYLLVPNKFKNVVSPSMKQDLETRGTTDFRLSLKSIPTVMFHYLPNSNAEGSAGAGVDCLGMMNLIPNKNEVGYLGFNNNKWEDENSEKREQSWELSDNLDEVFWVQHLDYFKRNTDGTFKNSIKDIYEARTPKDSSIDGVMILKLILV